MQWGVAIYFFFLEGKSVVVVVRLQNGAAFSLARPFLMRGETGGFGCPILTQAPDIVYSFSSSSCEIALHIPDAVPKNKGFGRMPRFFLSLSSPSSVSSGVARRKGASFITLQNTQRHIRPTFRKLFETHAVNCVDDGPDDSQFFNGEKKSQSEHFPKPMNSMKPKS